MKVNFFDLAAQYEKIKREVMREVEKVCSTQRFVLGENVRSLEDEVAGYSGARYGIGVASGSDAILVGLMALGVGCGDRVITTPYTFFSTAGSIARLGAVPVFADIDPRTYNIDPDWTETLLKRDRSRRIKAVIPVHLFGQPAEMSAIREIARRHGAAVIEDAAQSIGAVYKGKRAGSLADIGCFSFYPTKNLGGFGDGGMITTDRRRLADRIRMLRVHGSTRRYYHPIIGMNSRLDELQAAVLRVKLRRLDEWTEKRIRNAGLYTSLFEKEGLLDHVTPPHVEEGNVSVFNQYVVRVKKRNALKEHLAAKGIGTEIYYPVPLHLQKCFKYLGYKRGDLPRSEAAARQTLALPIYPELKDEEIRYVVSSIAGFYRSADKSSSG